MRSDNHIVYEMFRLPTSRLTLRLNAVPTADRINRHQSFANLTPASAEKLQPDQFQRFQIKPDFAFGRTKVTYQFNVADRILDLENVRDLRPIVVAGESLSGKAAGNAQTSARSSIRMC